MWLETDDMVFNTDAISAIDKKTRTLYLTGFKLQLSADPFDTLIKVLFKDEKIKVDGDNVMPSGNTTNKRKRVSK